MIPRGAEILLQRIVGTREIGMIIAMKQARPITGGHFAEGGEHRDEGFRGFGRVLHFRQERFVSLTHLSSRVQFVIGENMGGTMHPGISLLHI